VERALTHKEIVAENILLKQQLHEKYNFENIVGKSGAMQKVYEMMEKVSQTDSTVLIYGESGTGKELVAKAIHHHSDRKERPFVAINCGGLPEGLLESELFGHVRGAFTGAVSDKVGLFQVADLGTIFLDEISATSSAIQVKLLRVLQEKEIKRVGDTKDIPVDVRVVAATNKLLLEEVKKGTFREDLYYRLSVIPVYLPPLRERTDDIPLLVGHFLLKHSGARKRNFKTLGTGVLDILISYNWPGNVRELENVIERAITLCEGTVILPKDLPDGILKAVGADITTSSMLLKDVINKKEKEYIHAVIEQLKGDKKAAAEKLGIDLATLYRKLQK
jgi:transcriptional regulator with PAS, ATPase and Fis domain